MKHVWDIDYCPKKLPEQMNVFELRDYVKRLEEKLENKDKTIKAIIDGNRRPHGEWIRYTEDGFDYAKCSACKWDSGEAFEYAIDRFPFCPNCGSDNRPREEA